MSSDHGNGLINEELEIIFSTIRLRSGFEDCKCLHGCDVDEFRNLEFWNASLFSCIPCTRCSKNKGKIGKSWTLRGCGHDRDTVCGTMEQFHNELSKLRKKRVLKVLKEFFLEYTIEDRKNRKRYVALKISIMIK